MSCSLLCLRKYRHWQKTVGETLRGKTYVFNFTSSFHLPESIKSNPPKKNKKTTTCISSHNKVFHKHNNMFAFHILEAATCLNRPGSFKLNIYHKIYMNYQQRKQLWGWTVWISKHLLFTTCKFNHISRPIYKLPNFSGQSIVMFW